MRRLFRAEFLLAATLAPVPALAGIEHLRSCGTEWGGNTVGISRGSTNDVTVEGFGVDLATSVDSNVSGLNLSVLSRKNGFGSNIVLRFVPPEVGDGKSGVVTLHYFGGGTDVFNIVLPAGPKVTSIAFVPDPGVSTSGGTTRVTSLDTHVIVLKGTNLDALGVNTATFAQAGLREAKNVLTLPGEVRVSFKPDAGQRSFGDILYSYGGTCPRRLSSFELAFTVFDPPRTPTPTATATRTPTRPPLGAPVVFTPVKGPSFPPTPTPHPSKGKGTP